MADDVTKDDLDLIWKHLNAVEAGLKETVRLLKINDEFDKDINNNFIDHIKQNQDSFKGADKKMTDLEKRVSDLEKKASKK